MNGMNQNQTQTIEEKIVSYLNQTQFKATRINKKVLNKIGVSGMDVIACNSKKFILEKGNTNSWSISLNEELI